VSLAAVAGKTAARLKPPAKGAAPAGTERPASTPSAKRPERRCEKSFEFMIILHEVETVRPHANTIRRRTGSIRIAA
jgi:hypothetical protein